jgi:hypothetical protein
MPPTDAAPETSKPPLNPSKTLENPLLRKPLSKRLQVSAIHKANIMKKADGLFIECCRSVGGAGGDRGCPGRGGAGAAAERRAAGGAGLKPQARR